MTTWLTVADLDAHSWASCGQTAFAALLKKPLADVRVAFPPHTRVNFTQMRTALRTAAVSFDSTGYTLAGHSTAPGYRSHCWPQHGLMLLQFSGPWEAPGVPVAASLKATHWVAVTPLEGGAPDGEPWVFDVNALADNMNHGWLPRSYWEAKILAPLIASFKRATGGWWVRASIEVTLPTDGSS